MCEHLPDDGHGGCYDLPLPSPSMLVGSPIKYNIAVPKVPKVRGEAREQECVGRARG